MPMLLQSKSPSGLVEQDMCSPPSRNHHLGVDTSEAPSLRNALMVSKETVSEDEMNVQMGLTQ